MAVLCSGSGEWRGRAQGALKTHPANSASNQRPRGCPLGFGVHGFTSEVTSTEVVAGPGCGKFGGICFTPPKVPGTPAPPARLLGAFCQADFPGVSCIDRAARASPPFATIRSDTPAGLAPAGWTPSAGGTAWSVTGYRNLFGLRAFKASMLLISWSRIRRSQACESNETRAWALYATKQSIGGHAV
jgi:hypothetical protein